jgi:hypothetical protein
MRSFWADYFFGTGVKGGVRQKRRASRFLLSDELEMSRDEFEIESGTDIELESESDWQVMRRD